MSSDNDRAEPEWTKDIMDTDDAARSHKTFAGCEVVEEVEFVRYVIGVVVIIEEDEVEQWAGIAFKIANGINVQDGDTFEVKAGSGGFLPAFFV